MAKTTENKIDDSESVELLAETLQKIERGELSTSLGAKDRYIAGLLEFLNQNPEEMDSVFDKAQSQYQGKEITYSRQKSDIVRLLFLNGLQAVDPDYLELLRSAAAEHARHRI